MSKPRVPTGHQFFGSGNLMLAGFLEDARPTFLERAALTRCTPFARAGQARRFPEVEWPPYDDAGGGR